MNRREKLFEWSAALITLGALVGIPFLVLRYQHKRVAQVAAGAQVVDLYADGKYGVWSQAPILAWNAGRIHPVKTPIRVQAGRPILFRVTSVDVHHSFSIRELGVLPQDINPGHWTEIKVDAQDPGSYTILCYTVCGHMHTTMDADLEVQ